MSNLNTLQDMLLKVATALGPEILSEVAFDLVTRRHVLCAM